jgi:hypothetical protein
MEISVINKINNNNNNNNKGKRYLQRRMSTIKLSIEKDEMGSRKWLLY